MGKPEAKGQTIYTALITGELNWKTGTGSEENFKKGMRSGKCALYGDTKETQFTQG